MKFSLVLTALLATLTLSACGSQKNSGPAASAVDQTQSENGPVANQFDPQNAESLAGYWILKGSETKDLIQIRSTYNSSKETIETHVLGLNLNEELGYTFLATADKDELLLELNQASKTLQALTQKKLNGSEASLIKIDVAPIDKETLELKISSGDSSFSKTFIRGENTKATRSLFEKEQTDRTVQLFAKTLGRKKEACKGYEIQYSLRQTECVIETLKQNPELIQDSKVIAAAVEASNSELVKYLLSNGAAATRTDRQRDWKRGEGLLEAALANSWTTYEIGDHGMVNSGAEKPLISKMLIEAGAELNPKNENDTFYALPEALIKLRDPQLIELMIQKGAKLRSVDGKPEKFEFFFFDYMNRWGDSGPRLIELLIKVVGADPNSVYGDRSGGIIDWAIERADVAALKAMIANGADVKNYRTSKGNATQVCDTEIQELKASLNDKKMTALDKKELAASIVRIQQNRAFIQTL